MMKRIECAKPTDENSPAIYRWEHDYKHESSPRSGRPAVTEPLALASGSLKRYDPLASASGSVSVVRFTGSGKLLTTSFPSLKCCAVVTRLLRSLYMPATATLILVAALSVSAQRKPSEATRPFVVMSSQSLDDLQKTLQPDNKTVELIDSAGMQLRVAVQHEKNKAGAAAELHDASDDVYYVLDGSATLVLGGKLDAPKETDPGEWRSPRILNGKTVEIRKGDLVVVPRGTPHQRSTENKDFTMILIKIYSEPLKKRT